jgi:hypothetical protein
VCSHLTFPPLVSAAVDAPGPAAAGALDYLAADVMVGNINDIHDTGRAEGQPTGDFPASGKLTGGLMTCCGARARWGLAGCLLQVVCLVWPSTCSVSSSWLEVCIKHVVLEATY